MDNTGVSGGATGREESSFTSKVHAVSGKVSGLLHARDIGTTTPFYNSVEK